MNNKFEGIVLFKRLHREHDSLVKIFTKDYGTKMFFIRGLEKPSHPHKVQLLPLTINQYIGTINDQGLSFIQEAATIDMLHSIQTSHHKLAYASYIAQLTDASISDNLKDEKLYSMFKKSLELINSDISYEAITIYMEIQLLHWFGTGFNFTQCAICGSQQQPFDFSINYQGVLCLQHMPEDEFRLQINPKAMYIASRLSVAPIDLIHSISVSQATMKELRRLMDYIYQEFVGIKLKSKSYLNQLDKINQAVQQMKDKRNKAD